MKTLIANPLKQMNSREFFHDTSGSQLVDDSKQV